MFKVKRIEDGKIFQVLGTHCEDLSGKPYFLIWDGHWHWTCADKFVPPNYELKEEKK